MAFIGLSRDERHYLETWLRTDARSMGIDAADDLGGRRWPCRFEGAVIGIFGAGAESASWLVVKHNGEWAVAQCADLTVSRPVASLAEALEIICPGAGFHPLRS